MTKWSRHDDGMKPFLDAKRKARPLPLVLRSKPIHHFSRDLEIVSNKVKIRSRAHVQNDLMEGRGFVRQQARVYGVSGKAWVGIRLKEHDELMVELPEEVDRHQKSQEGEDHWRRPVKPFPLRGAYKSVFSGGVKVG